MKGPRLKKHREKTKENVVVQEHSLVMIKWGIIPKIRKLRGLANHFLARFSSLRLASSAGKYNEHGRPNNSHAITSCEVEVSLFPTHGMHSKHLWSEGMLQKNHNECISHISASVSKTIKRPFRQ